MKTKELFPNLSEVIIKRIENLSKQFIDSRAVPLMETEINIGQNHLGILFHKYKESTLSEAKTLSANELVGCRDFLVILSNMYKTVTQKVLQEENQKEKIIGEISNLKI